MAEPNLTAEQVQRWLDDLDKEIGEVQRRIEPLLLDQSKLQERKTLLKELLASFGEAPDAVVATRISRAKSTVSESTRDRVHRHAVEIFQQENRPLHINDLHHAFLARGFDIPGKGEPVNITVHLSNWDDIASPERGVYGLVEHVGPTRRVPQQRRRTKKKARSR